LGMGDWGLGIGDWGLGPIPNPQSPIPNFCHSNMTNEIYKLVNNKDFILIMKTLFIIFYDN